MSKDFMAYSSCKDDAEGEQKLSSGSRGCSSMAFSSFFCETSVA